MTAVAAKARQGAALQTPTDLGAQATKDVTAALNLLLADMFALYLKTKNFHWHMSGPHFRDYHLMLDDQGDQIFATTDAIAERARKLGGTTIRSIGEIHRLQRLLDNDAGYVTPKYRTKHVHPRMPERCIGQHLLARHLAQQHLNVFPLVRGRLRAGGARLQPEPVIGAIPLQADPRGRTPVLRPRAARRLGQERLGGQRESILAQHRFKLLPGQHVGHCPAAREHGHLQAPPARMQPPYAYIRLIFARIIPRTS